jgi:hypothetical protein
LLKNTYENIKTILNFVCKIWHSKSQDSDPDPKHFENAGSGSDPYRTYITNSVSDPYSFDTDPDQILGYIPIRIRIRIRFNDQKLKKFTAEKKKFVRPISRPS